MPLSFIHFRCSCGLKDDNEKEYLLFLDSFFRNAVQNCFSWDSTYKHPNNVVTKKAHFLTVTLACLCRAAALFYKRFVLLLAQTPTVQHVRIRAYNAGAPMMHEFIRLTGLLLQLASSVIDLEFFFAMSGEELVAFSEFIPKALNLKKLRVSVYSLAKEPAEAFLQRLCKNLVLQSLELMVIEEISDDAAAMSTTPAVLQHYKSVVVDRLYKSISFVRDLSLEHCHVTVSPAYLENLVEIRYNKKLSYTYVRSYESEVLNSCIAKELGTFWKKMHPHGIDLRSKRDVGSQKFKPQHLHLSCLPIDSVPKLGPCLKSLSDVKTLDISNTNLSK
jgi:hypothetical protein